MTPQAAHSERSQERKSKDHQHQSRNNTPIPSWCKIVKHHPRIFSVTMFFIVLYICEAVGTFPTPGPSPAAEKLPLPNTIDQVRCGRGVGVVP